MRVIAVACIALTLVLHDGLGFPAGAERPKPGSGGNRSIPHPGTSQIIVQEAGLAEALQCLVGPGVEVANETLTAAPGAVGLFFGASAIIGLNEGLILSSGNVITLAGPNMLDDTSYDNGLPGDADLDALIPGYTTYDATILEFDFTCDNPTVVSFQYVFASEEYNEWVASDFNDVFGFFLNGTNIAFVPADCSSPGLPVAINNVDCENPYNPPGGPNCDCYRNNDVSDGGGTIDTEMDGLTQVFYATAELQPGDNHLKLAIADAGDHVLDSNVMLRCQSLTCAPPPQTGACCFGFDDDCFFLSQEQCVSQGGIYHGDIPCVPNPCPDVSGVGDGSGSSAVTLEVVPSPSAGEAVIAFTLPRPAEVSLEMFDVSGALVRRLASGYRSEGAHTVVWNGLDDDGRRVSSGNYFARIRTPDGARIARIVLIDSR